MEVQPDFRELLELFSAHAVEFVIVGAHALGSRQDCPRHFLCGLRDSVVNI